MFAAQTTSNERPAPRSHFFAFKLSWVVSRPHSLSLTKYCTQPTVLWTALILTLTKVDVTRLVVAATNPERGLTRHSIWSRAFLGVCTPSAMHPSQDCEIETCMPRRMTPLCRPLFTQMDPLPPSVPQPWSTLGCSCPRTGRQGTGETVNVHDLPNLGLVGQLAAHWFVIAYISSPG